MDGDSTTSLGSLFQCELRWVNDEKAALILLSDEGEDPKFLFKP